MKLVKPLTPHVIASGDSGMKKLGRHCRAKEKSRGPT